MRTLVESYADLPRWIRIPLWRLWHNLIIAWEKREVKMTVMNYGYAHLNGEKPLTLLPRDEAERYGIQLYHETALGAPIQGKEVLEVGSGRGGGASYISRYHHPRQYVGMDISERCIRFCNRYHALPNLHFVRGRSEALPFEDASFDVTLSVEASRSFPDVARFFREVHRVLKKGGTFLLTDMRWQDHVEELKTMLQESGFRIRDAVDITENVVKALQSDSTRRISLIRQNVPGVVLKAFSEFAGVQGSNRYEMFASGRMRYWRLVLDRVG